MNAANDFTIYDRKLHLAKRFMQDVTQAWKDVFPLSACKVNGDMHGNFVIFHGYLSDTAECASGVLLRDPIEYLGVYRGEVFGFVEELVGVYVKSPAGAQTVYHLSKLEPLSFYKPTREILLTRFHEVRRLVLNSRSDLKDCGFDVNEKLGV